MKKPSCLATGTLLLCLASVGPLVADDTHLGGIQLLPGYAHVPLQGIDSIVGQIAKEDGLVISYEIGHVSKPGQPQFGGGFRDRPKLTPQGELQWYREQTVGGQPLHLAYRKDKVLLASFPQAGINFHATIESSEDFADAMLMIVTYPEPAAD